MPVLKVNKSGVWTVVGGASASSGSSESGAVTDVFVASSTAPDNTKLLWIDTSNSNIMKFYNTDTSTWETIGAVWS